MVLHSATESEQVDSIESAALIEATSFPMRTQCRVLPPSEIAVVNVLAEKILNMLHKIENAFFTFAKWLSAFWAQQFSLWPRNVRNKCVIIRARRKALCIQARECTIRTIFTAIILKFCIT